MSSSWVYTADVSEEPADSVFRVEQYHFLLFYPEDGDEGLLRNVGACFPNYTCGIPEDLNLNAHCHENFIPHTLKA
jgi:hypothetical protein